MQPQELLGYRPITLIAKKRVSSLFLTSSDTKPTQGIVIKLFDVLLLEKPEEQTAFLEEITRLRALDHPAILPLRDAGLDQNRPYMISPYLANGSLRVHLNQGRLPLEQALELLQQIGEVLAYAHEQQILHANLKPENILLDAFGRAHLTDFALLTLAGKIKEMGLSPISRSTAYMAPEAFSGHTSPQSDQYALACLAFELITGSVPFPAVAFSTSQSKHSLQTPPSMKSFVPTLPDFIEEAISRALAKQPGQRYDTLGAFLAALTHAGAVPLTDAKPYSTELDTQPKPNDHLPKQEIVVAHTPHEPDDLVEPEPEPVSFASVVTLEKEPPTLPLAETLPTVTLAPDESIKPDVSPQSALSTFTDQALAAPSVVPEQHVPSHPRWQHRQSGKTRTFRRTGLIAGIIGLCILTIALLSMVTPLLAHPAPPVQTLYITSPTVPTASSTARTPQPPSNSRVTQPTTVSVTSTPTAQHTTTVSQTSSSTPPQAQSRTVPTPTPQASHNLVIYNHGVSPLFTDQTFSYVKRNACDTSLYLSPPCSYSIQYNQWGGLDFGYRPGNISAGNYTRLEWNMYLNNLPISDFGALLLDLNENEIHYVQLTSANITGTPATGWVHISVPISQLDPSQVSYNDIQIKNSMANALPANVYVDDVQLSFL